MEQGDRPEVVEPLYFRGDAKLCQFLPPGFTNHTQGLLGQMNSDPEDDLLTSLGKVIRPTDSSPEDLFEFGASCEYNGQDIEP